MPAIKIEYSNHRDCTCSPEDRLYHGHNCGCEIYTEFVAIDSLEGYDLARQIWVDSHPEYCLEYDEFRRFQHINVYANDRLYGGPEEGGWWYNVWEPHLSIPVIPGVHKEEVMGFLRDFYQCGRYNSDYIIRVEWEKAKAGNDYRPYC